MTSPRRFEQDLPVLLETLYLAGTPDYRDDLVQQIAATRQRPVWAFPERWLPVDITTQRVATPRMPWRAIGVLALIGILLAATIAAYIGSRPRPPEPFGLAQNGSIVYAADGDVFVRHAADGPSNPLITGPENETWAVHSPLGDRLAILRGVDGGEDLWVAAADGTGLVRIGGPYADLSWLDWSPDQTTIAISYQRPGFPTIELVATDGSGATRPVDIPAMWPTWRPPHGAQLLFRGQEDGRWSFYLLDPASGERTRLAIEGDRIEGGEYDLHAPAWSPTGDRLAYNSLVELPQSQMRTPGFRIFVADIAADGTVDEVRRLGDLPFVDDELNAIFTPDGASLVYQRRMGLTEDPPHPDTVDTLLIRPADGSGAPVELGVDSSPGEGFNWAIAPDGRSLLIHRFAEDDDLLVDPVAGTAVPTDIGSDTGISWQRKGP
jgi:dipeptidyl aminopeptidase/acylaminoacyl peptidase